MDPRRLPTGPIAVVVFALLATPIAAGPQADPETGGSAAESDEAFLSGEAATEQEGAASENADATVDGENGESHDRDHYFQGFVNLTFGTGWFLVAPYNKNDEDKACSEVDYNNQGNPEGDPVCFGRSTLHLDILGGFAPLSGFEVFLMTRLGLESPTRARDQSRWIGAGIKKYTPEEGLFKIGIGIAPLFAFSGTNVDVGYDFVLHVPIAFHFDFVKWVGAYAQIAPNLSFATEFRLDISAGVGVQGRFP